MEGKGYVRCWNARLKSYRPSQRPHRSAAEPEILDSQWGKNEGLQLAQVCPNSVMGRWPPYFRLNHARILRDTDLVGRSAS